MTYGARRIFLATAASALALSGHAAADHRDHDGEHSKHTAAEHAAQASGPSKIVDAFAVALASQNEKLVKKLLAEDVLIAEGGGAERSLAEYQAAHMGADMLFMSGVKSTLKSREEFVSGDMAVIVSESEAHGAYAAKPVHSRVMETMVLTRTDGEWRIQHIHWSSKDLAGGL